MSRSSLVIFSLLAAGCAAAPLDDGLGTTQDALWTIGAASGSPPEWDSNVSTDLSGWSSVTCNQTYGNDYIVTELTGFPQKGSLDLYLARLEVTCGEYTNQGVELTDDGVEQHALLVSSSYKNEPQVSANLNFWRPSYAAGVKIATNLGDGYVQNLEILFVHPTLYGLGNYGTPGEAGWITPFGYDGNDHVLICPDQYVMTGIAAQTSTGSGKIRRLKIYCRPLTED